MSKYLGPSDVFMVGDKEYRQGDNIPLSAESRRHHERFGHRFEDSAEPAPIIPATAAAPLLPPPPAAPAEKP